MQSSPLPVNPIYVAYFIGLLFYVAFLAMLYPLFRDMSEEIVESDTGGKVLAVFGALMAAGFSGALMFLFVYELIALVVVFSSLLGGVELIRVAKPSIIGLVVFVFGVAVDLVQ